MIFRQIVIVNSKGSKEAGNLEPDITLEPGFNLKVLEYREDGKAVVEIWCSDNIILDNMAKGRRQLADFTRDMEKLRTHPKSPRIIGLLAVSEQAAEAIDEATKRVRIRGKEVPFLRVERDTGIIIDEG